MKIGIDLDEVLCDTVTSLLRYHNETYGTNYTRDEIKSYDLWKLWGGTRQQAIQIVYDFYESPYFDKMEPVTDAVEGTKELTTNHELHIVTSRPTDLASGTKRWVEYHFPNIFSETHFTNQWNISNSSHQKKSSICLNHGLRIMIDDCLEHVIECAERDIPSFLFDCPWNKLDNLPSGITRVYNWQQAMKTITNL
tara:strand:- start:6075 stop:6659 length:585 start_codon:yes stop_codon:yes gene_type:complete